MDESGFHIGQGKKEAVITAYPEINTQIASASTRELLTVIKCVAANGFVMSPMIIFTSKAHIKEWYHQQGLKDNYIITISDNRYITDQIAFKWVQKFKFQTQNRTRKGYRLLIDNHGSHLTHEFIEYCDSKKIILYYFPSHTTHLLQPLDGIPFQQYKHFHGKVVNQQARLGGQNFKINLTFYTHFTISSPIRSNHEQSGRDLQIKAFIHGSLRLS
jgi:hypothetical protein